MIRHCDGNDPNLRAEDNTPCACGKTFDDVDTSTAYPHFKFGGVLKEAARQMIEGMSDEEFRSFMRTKGPGAYAGAETFEEWQAKYISDHPEGFPQLPTLKWLDITIEAKGIDPDVIKIITGEPEGS